MDAHGGPGGWGPGPSGPPPRRRRRTGLAAGAGAVVVAGLVVLALFLTGVFGGDDEGSSPTDVAGRYLRALVDGDQSAAGGEVCPADQAGLARQVADFARLQVTRFEAGQYHEKDATHVVVNAVVVTRQDTSDERPLDLPMVKQNGTWRVCVSNGAGGSAAGSGPASAAASASWDPNSARAADVFAKISTLYNGLTNASSQAASDGNPVPVGLYVRAHNFPGLKYTAAECTPPKLTRRSDSSMYQPQRATVRPDPTYTKVTVGRYSGTVVTGTVYRLTLEVDGPDGAQSTPTHVTEIDGTYYFFRICE